MATSTQSNDWVFGLCGTCTFKSIDIRRVAEKDMQEELSHFFEAEPDAIIGVHHENEQCKESRSSKTLLEPHAYEGNPIHVHFQRRATPTAEVGSWFGARPFFRLSDDSPIRDISPTIWRSRLIMVARSLPTTELVATIRNMIKSKLKRDPLLNDLQLPTDQELEEEIETRPCLEIRFKTVVHSPTDTQASLDLDSEDSYMNRVELVQDLFQDLESVRHLEIPINVTFWISKRQIQDGRDVVKRYLPRVASPVYIRVGSSLDKTGGGKDIISVEYPLLAKLLPVSFSFDGLLSMKAWDFGDLKMNDVKLAREVPFEPSQLSGRFGTAQTLTQLAVGAEKAHDRGDYGRVPRSPNMALTPIHSACGARMNRCAETAIAVSIINHLEDATLRNLDMAINCQIVTHKSRRSG